MGTLASRVVVGTISAGVSFIALGGVGGATGDLPSIEAGEARLDVAALGADDAGAPASADSDVSPSSSAPAPPVTTGAPAPSIAPSPATASTTTSTSTTVGERGADHERAQRLGAEALARIRFDWADAFPDWTIEFHTSREGLRALTYPHEQRIEVFVRTSDDPSSLHRVIAHELGHVVDVELNDDDDRSRWREERGMASDVPWWPDESKPDFATGAGDFAEAFAVWEAGIVSQSSAAGALDRGDLELFTQLLER